MDLTTILNPFGIIATSIGENIALLLFAITIFVVAFIGSKIQSVKEKCGIYLPITLIACVLIIVATALQRLIPEYVDYIHSFGQLILCLFLIFWGMKAIGEIVIPEPAAPAAPGAQPANRGNIISRIIKGIIGFFVATFALPFLVQSLEVVSSIPGLQFLSIISRIIDIGIWIVPVLLVGGVAAAILWRVGIGTTFGKTVVSLIVVGLGIAYAVGAFILGAVNAGVAFIVGASIISWIVYRIVVGGERYGGVGGKKWIIGVLLLIALIGGGLYAAYYFGSFTGTSFTTIAWVGVAILIVVWIVYRSLRPRPRGPRAPRGGAGLSPAAWRARAGGAATP